MTNISFLIIFLVVLGVGATLTIVWYLYQGYRFAKKNAELENLTREMGDFLENIDDRKRSKKFPKPSGDNLSNLMKGNLTDPAILSTLLTTIVGKYGTLRVGVLDFTALRDSDYVSIYIDTTTNDILLALNSSLGDELDVTMASFTPPDDNTFN